MFNRDKEDKINFSEVSNRHSVSEGKQVLKRAGEIQRLQWYDFGGTNMTQ